MTADHYPFGMQMGDRTYPSGDNYRFGYHGMMGDKEWSGQGNSYMTEFRMYDPRLGRWLSRDPIVQVWESEYVAFSNNPIYFVDLNGASPKTWLKNTIGKFTTSIGNLFSKRKKVWVKQEEKTTPTPNTSSPSDNGSSGQDNTPSSDNGPIDDVDTECGGEGPVNDHPLFSSLPPRPCQVPGRRYWIDIPLCNASDLSVSEDLVNFLKAYETFASNLYNDNPTDPQNGHATYGYGHLMHRGPPTPADYAWFNQTYPSGMTEQQADHLLRLDITGEAESTIRTAVTCTITQFQYDALVSLTFNIGMGAFRGSSVLRDINSEGRFSLNISAHWQAWNITGGRVSDGLIARRRAELRIYFLDIYDSSH